MKGLDSASWVVERAAGAVAREEAREVASVAVARVEAKEVGAREEAREVTVVGATAVVLAATAASCANMARG